MNLVHDITPDKKVVEFRAWHLLSLDLRPFDRMAMGALHLSRVAHAYERTGFSFTGMQGGRPVCCWGVVPMPWDGVAEAWLVTSPDLPHVAKTFHAETKRQLDQFIEGLALHRLEIMVLERHKVARRWAEALGFTEEGVRRMWGPGKDDFVIYARLIERNDRETNDA